MRFHSPPVLATIILAAGALLVAQTAPPLVQPEPFTGAAKAPPPLPSATPIPGLTPTSLLGMVVVLDPGHGGEDVGVQAGEVREARLTLAIARRIAATLVAHGARVALTRKDDTAISEDERASLANRAGGRVFVSVHLNRSRHQASIGAEVYTHESQVRNSSLNSDAFTSTRVAGLVRWDHVQDRHRPDAERLADYIESALGARIPLSRHPRYSLPLRTLAGADMPAVLLELAYLSNPDQAAAVVTEKFQTSVAAAIAVALENYRLGVGSR